MYIRVFGGHSDGKDVWIEPGWMVVNVPHPRKPLRYHRADISTMIVRDEWFDTYEIFWAERRGEFLKFGVWDRIKPNDRALDEYARLVFDRR